MYDYVPLSRHIQIVHNRLIIIDNICYNYHTKLTSSTKCKVNGVVLFYPSMCLIVDIINLWPLHSPSTKCIMPYFARNFSLPSIPPGSVIISMLWMFTLFGNTVPHIIDYCVDRKSNRDVALTLLQWIVSFCIAPDETVFYSVTGLFCRSISILLMVW